VPAPPAQPNPRGIVPWSDTAAGQLLGLTLGQYFVQRATAPATGQSFGAWRFDGERYPATQDFEPRRFTYDPSTDQEKLDTSILPVVDPPYIDYLPSQRPPRSPILGWLWDQAMYEWTAFKS